MPYSIIDTLNQGKTISDELRFIGEATNYIISENSVFDGATLQIQINSGIKDDIIWNNYRKQNSTDLFAITQPSSGIMREFTIGMKARFIAINATSNTQIFLKIR